jgi:lipid-binding SYLF domain-containing protein
MSGEFDMEKILTRASEALDKVEKARLIPEGLWKACKGVVLISFSEIGFVFSLNTGDGIVIKKNQDGTWGAPSALMYTGVGAGAVLGKGSKTLVMFCLTDYGLNMFTAENRWQIGGQAGFAVGPRGGEFNATWEAGGHGTTVSAAGVLYYVLSEGALLDVGIQDNFISTVDEVNEAFYGRSATATDIVNKPGAVDMPSSAALDKLRTELERVVKHDKK